MARTQSGNMLGQRLRHRQQPPANVRELVQHCNRNEITFLKMIWGVSLGVHYTESDLVWPTEEALPPLTLFHNGGKIAT
jgi:hypothetical protein